MPDCARSCSRRLAGNRLRRTGIAHQSRWDHLWVSIPWAGLGLSGQPFVGADVGGFMGHADTEMFLRWMQYGALTLPLPLQISNVDRVRMVLGRNFARGTCATRSSLRYHGPSLSLRVLRPAARTGATVQRPLVFDHQYDVAVRDLDDEFLLGPTCWSPSDPASNRPGRSTCPRAAGTTWGTPGRRGGGRGLMLIADGPDPDLREGRRGHADVAGGATLHRPPPPADRAAPLRAGCRRDVHLAACRRTRARPAALEGGRKRTTFEVAPAPARR